MDDVIGLSKGPHPEEKGRLAILDPDWWYKFKHHPYAHQYRILKESWDKKGWAWFLGTGTGKSKLTIDNMCMLFLTGEIDAAIIMAKKGEYDCWALEHIPTHMPDGVEYEVFLFSSFENLYVTRANVKRREDFLKYKPNVLRIMVFNVEAMIGKGASVMDTFIKSCVKGFFGAIDESTCIKNHTSKRSKEVYLRMAKAKYRRVMTGTPVPKGPLDCWGQLIALGPKPLGFASYYAFRGTYANFVKQYFGTRSFMTLDPKEPYKNLEDLGRKLSITSHQLNKEDCLDLPPKVYHKRYIQLTPEQTKLYRQMKEEAILQIEGYDSIEVTNALAMIVKLHQIVCGQLKLEEKDSTGGDKYISIPHNRFIAVHDILEDYDGKCIIWAGYRQTLTDIYKEMQDAYGVESVARVYGGVDEEERLDGITRFKDATHKKTRFMVANPQSAGYGHTWVAAKRTIYYANSYNLELRLQSEDRNHRIGQDESVDIFDLMCPGTVEERIVEVLRDKKRIEDLILSRTFREWL